MASYLVKRSGVHLVVRADFNEAASGEKLKVMRRFLMREPHPLVPSRIHVNVMMS
jgi:hypothetical protein